MGASFADIVYDYYQNNGMTRFHAIFYSQNAEEVGPIRSARLLDAELMQMYKTGLAFGGADARILKRFTEKGLTERTLLTATTDTTFSMVFDGWPNGKALVMQGVDLGVSRNVNIRFEDI